MNTDLLQRATFVLDRPTAERLTVIATRLGVSRSELVRDVLAEPIEMMHRWVSSLPENPTQADAAAMLDKVAGDVEGWLDSKTAQFELLKVPTNGHA